MPIKISKAEAWLLTKIAGFKVFNFSESGLIILAPTSLLTTGPIILPQKLPILTLSERKGSASNIKHIVVKDQKVNQRNPIVNRSVREIGPIFFLSAIFVILVVTL